jgi:hypothetical protein
MALSSNGSNSGTGVLWAISPVIYGASGRTLYAFNAENLGCPSDGGACSPLWSTTIGKDPPFEPPLVAHGKVYVVSPDADGSGYVQPYFFPCTSGYTWDDSCEQCYKCGTGTTWCSITCSCCRGRGCCSAPPP